MQTFDFLPARYRERNAARRSRLWQLGVASLFALGILATAAGQQLLRRSVSYELREIEARHAAAAAKERELHELRMQLASAQESAALLTYLRFPWPVSQLVAELIEPIPASIALAELTIHQAETAVSPRRGRTPDAAATEVGTPASRDLADLRARFDRQDASLSVEGRARDVAELHRYVGQLADSPLFRTATLESLESDSREDGASFALKLVVAAGHGQREVQLSQHE